MLRSLSNCNNVAQGGVGVHVKILYKGVGVWNEWRKENPSICPDLSDANFSEVDLRRANLTNTVIRRANFVNADLGGANLSGANLCGSDLRGANLSEAYLGGTNLNGANLSGANMESATLRDTILSNTCMNDVKNLESCVHRGLSIIDFRTIAKSGDLPLSFLQRCGLPKNLISFLINNNSAAV